jgi:hypothetical protein
MEQTNNSKMFTQIKDMKAQHELQMKREKAYNDLYLKAFSFVIQPIESLFNWQKRKLIFKVLAKYDPR